MQRYLCAAVMFTVALSVNAQQGSQPPNLPLLNSGIQTLRGTFNPNAPKFPTDPTGTNGTVGGCNFTFTLDLDQKAMEARFVPGSIIRFDENTSTCQAEFEVGEPQDAVIQWDAQQLKNADAISTSFGEGSAVVHRGEVRSAMVGHITTPSPRLAGYINAAGYLYASFTDPVGLTVNSVYVRPQSVLLYFASALPALPVSVPRLDLQLPPHVAYRERMVPRIGSDFSLVSA